MITDAAFRDIRVRAELLKGQRGSAFASLWTDSLFDWLENLASTGAQLGTEHPNRPEFRTFGYKRQATILAEFADGEMRIVRVYFPGQDWSS